MTGPLHDDEIPVGTTLVRALVDRALPAWSSLTLRPLSASGSSNALFRLGDNLLVRLSRQPGGSETIDKEARWLPCVGPTLPVPVPEVVLVGEPALGYPERWSVVPWLDGDPVAVVEPGSEVDPRRCGLAHDLAAVVNGLRNAVVPDGALADAALRWYRGAPLANLDDTTRRNLAACPSGAGARPRCRTRCLGRGHGSSRRRAAPPTVAPRRPVRREPAGAGGARTMPDRCAGRLAMARSVLADAAPRTGPAEVRSG